MERPILLLKAEDATLNGAEVKQERWGYSSKATSNPAPAPTSITCSAITANRHLQIGHRHRPIIPQ